MAASKTPRRSSGEGERRSPWWTAFANVNVCSAVSQSPNSFDVWNRAIRTAAARGHRGRDALRPTRRCAARRAARPRSPAGRRRAARPRRSAGRRRLPPAGSSSKARSRIATTSTGWRQAFDSSIRSAIGVLRRERREDELGEAAVPADDVERLERLVREVEDVAGADVAVVGRRGEEHVRELPVVGARAHGRDDAALGALRVAHLDELAEPALEHGDVGLAARAAAGRRSAAPCRRSPWPRPTGRGAARGRDPRRRARGAGWRSSACIVRPWPKPPAR